MDMKFKIRYKTANMMRHLGYDFREDQQPEVIDMQKSIKALRNQLIDFDITVYPDGSWMAKSTNVKGLLAGSRKQDQINELINDAIFTYYGVPPQYANDKLLRNSGQLATHKQQVQVTT